VVSEYTIMLVNVHSLWIGGKQQENNKNLLVVSDQHELTLGATATRSFAEAQIYM
jgi:hypothetical protein